MKNNQTIKSHQAKNKKRKNQKTQWKTGQNNQNSKTFFLTLTFILTL
jgi:hypothetical protein